MRKLQDKTVEKEFFNKLALERHKRRLNPEEVVTRITTYVSNHLRNEDKLDGLILDAGCGNSEFGKKLAEYGCSVIGVDISPEMAQDANFNPVLGFTAIEGDIEKPDLFESESIDGILCCGILHHFPSLEASCLLENFFRWLKPGGFVFTYEPNGSNPIMKISNIFGKIFSKINLFSQHISPNDVTHTYFTYRRAFQRRGFTLLSATTIMDKNVTPLPRLLAISILIKQFLLSLSNKCFSFPCGGSALFMIFKVA